MLLGIIATGVLIWYGVPVLQRDEKVKAGALTSDRRTLGDQIAHLKDEFAARVAVTRQRARESGEALYARMQSKIDLQVQSVRERLQHLESGAQKGDTQVATLQEELKQVKTEMERRVTYLNEELAQVRWQLDENGNRSERAIAGLRDGEQRNRADVDAIANTLAVERVDFEVTKNHSRDVAPGISVGITGVDTAYRRVDGWLSMVPDRRTVWLKSQNLQEPVTFYGNKDGLKRELVITNVTPEGISGYLLLPRQARPATGETAPDE